MTIHVSCFKCKKELDPFDLKPHKCESSYDFKKINEDFNKEYAKLPVAWVDKLWIDRPETVKKIGIENMFMRHAQGIKNYVPLYTHPAKTLTDEEIDDFTVRIYNCRTGAEAHEIVLAILRKASEK